MTRGWAEKQRLGDLPAYARAEGSDIQQFANFDEEAQLLLEGEKRRRFGQPRTVAGSRRQPRTSTHKLPKPRSASAATETRNSTPPSPT